MNLEDLDIDELIDDEKELNEDQQADNFVVDKLETLAGKMFSNGMIKQLKVRLFIIGRLLELGASERTVKNDYAVLYPPPKVLGNGKCFERYKAVRDGLIALATEINRMK